MSRTDDGRLPAHVALSIWHLIVPLATLLSFYLVEQPQQHEVARRTADLRTSIVKDKIRFIEERLKFGSVLETDVLKFMGSPDRISEEPSQTVSAREDQRYRLLMWRIGKQEVWGVFVKDGLVFATWGPGPASLPIIARTPPVPAGNTGKH